MEEGNIISDLDITKSYLQLIIKMQSNAEFPYYKNILKGAE